MAGFEVETTTYRIGADDYRIRALRDRQQYWDPDGRAARAGISSASWPLFGLVWPSGLVLADAMSRAAIAGKTILEVGCGLGLASLVLSRRGAAITASDHHPLAREFLRVNAALNGLPPIGFAEASWTGSNPELGVFDLIIGSDVLYERGHHAALTGFLARHAAPTCTVIVVDPGRSERGRFGAAMRSEGYAQDDARPEGAARSSRLMSFVRDALVH